MSPPVPLYCAAFLANFGWVNISSQLILPKAAFLLSSSQILLLLPVCVWHFVSTRLADCSPRLHWHSGESNPVTFLECKNFLRPIFFVLIWITRALAALQRLLCIFSVFFVGFGQIAYNSLPVFSFDQASSYSSKVFCSDASL